MLRDLSTEFLLWPAWLLDVLPREQHQCERHKGPIDGAQRGPFFPAGHGPSHGARAGQAAGKGRGRSSGTPTERAKRGEKNCREGGGEAENSKLTLCAPPPRTRLSPAASPAWAESSVSEGCEGMEWD